MKQNRFACILFLFGSFNTISVSAQTNTKADEKTIAFLNTFRATYIKSILDKKPEGMQIYYDKNIRLMTEFQRTVIGSPNVVQYHKAFLSRFTISAYTREQTEILDLGLMVVEQGMFVMKMISKKTNKEHTVNGKYQNIWEKNSNGKMLLITEGWNYNQPLDLQDQLRFDEVPVVDVALQPHLPINNNIRFELAALNRMMEVTITQHDAKIWSFFYTDSCILFTQRHDPYVGRKAIDEYLEMHVKELPVFEKLDIRNDRIDDLGNYVIEYASHIASWRSGEYSGIGLGKDLRIWRRERDGSLKIFRHIGMYD
ncbi:MAG TPA: nuclear transport factor 2 family protein [Cyclobacteriaceae bacterium]|nr:nuclear transport factor 2 family protein [Cyclobacteriaceae bacterium]